MIHDDTIVLHTYIRKYVLMKQSKLPHTTFIDYRTCQAFFLGGWIHDKICNVNTFVDDYVSLFVKIKCM